jgi:hypothetical protein
MSTLSAGSTRIYRTEAGKDIHAVIAEFANPADISHAAEHVRDAGYTRWDVYAPFPIHGIDEAMGLKRPLLPLITAIMGLSGATLGFLFQWWVSVEGYRTVVQGKPYGAWQPLVPVTFEFGVIFTAFTALLGMLAFNGLPRWHHPLMTSDRFLGVSDDKFIIAIEASDPQFDPAATRELLRKHGATAIELVEE